MRNYEIVFLVHPDQSDQTPSILSKLDKITKDSGGKVHRSENIGNRKLAYPIQDQFKASYGLLNIECNQEAINEIKNSFKFNDSIIRNLVLAVKKVNSDPSALLVQTKEDNEKFIVWKADTKILNKLPTYINMKDIINIESGIKTEILLSLIHI